jgi:photosystem II stability/assembly factor-like uncharacterized protein
VGTGVQPAGGPTVGYVADSGPGGQLFAWCNLVAVRPSSSQPWVVKRLSFDVAAAAVLGDGGVFGVGYQFAGGFLRFLTVQGSVSGTRPWAAVPISGAHPSAYDSISCDPSGALCVAFPGALTLWSQLCPQGGMGQPSPPTALTPLPLFVYRSGAGWSQLTSLPSSGVFASATVTGAGDVVVGGSRGDGGLLVESSDQGESFDATAAPPYPVAGVASSGREVVAVGGGLGCVAGSAAPAAGQQVLRSPDGGLTWQTQLINPRGEYPLTAVSLSNIGRAAVGAGIEPQCTSGPIQGCYASLVTIGASGTVTKAPGVTVDPAALAAGPGDQLLAVTPQGLLLSSPDGSGAWQLESSVTPPPLTAVHFFPGHPNEGVAEIQVGASLLSLQTRDGGTIWGPGPKLPAAPTGPIAWGSPQVGYAVGEGGSGPLLKTTDAGRRWLKLAWPGQSLEVISLQFQSPRVGWAAVDIGYGSAEVLQTTDGGTHWIPMRLAQLTAPQGSCDLAAMETGGQTTVAVLYEWGWRQWTGDEPPRSRSVNGPEVPQAIAIQAGGGLWAAGVKDWWYRPTGEVWVGTSSLGPRELGGLPANSAPGAIGFASAQAGWMLVNGVLFRTGDGGRRWTELPVRAQYVEGVTIP